jgi:hypothetical protein
MEHDGPKSTVTTEPLSAPPLVPAWEHVEAERSTIPTPTGTEPKGLEGTTLTHAAGWEPDSATVTLNLTSKLAGDPCTTTPGEATTSLTALVGAVMA